MKSDGKEIGKNFKKPDPYFATSHDLATSKVDTDGFVAKSRLRCMY